MKDSPDAPPTGQARLSRVWSLIQIPIKPNSNAPKSGGNSFFANRLRLSWRPHKHGHYFGGHFPEPCASIELCQPILMIVQQNKEKEKSRKSVESDFFIGPWNCNASCTTHTCSEALLCGLVGCFAESHDFS